MEKELGTSSVVPGYNEMMMGSVEVTYPCFCVQEVRIINRGCVKKTDITFCIFKLSSKEKQTFSEDELLQKYHAWSSNETINCF